MTRTTRQRRRRRLLLAGLLPLLLALAFAAKVAVMLAHDDAGRTAYGAGGYADARSSFSANATLNYLEPWVSPYDEGTARYRLGDFPGAVRLLTTALATVPPAEECRVRINLSLAHESVGDAAVAGGDREAARRSWSLGARALTDGGCLELTPAEKKADEQDPAGATEDEDAENAGAENAGADARQAEDDTRRARRAERRAQVRDATAVDRRLRDKLGQQPPEGPTSESDDPEARQQARQDAARLEERNEQAQEVRREQQQRRQDREAEEQRQQEEQEQQPGTGDGDGEGEPLTYEW